MLALIVGCALATWGIAASTLAFRPVGLLSGIHPAFIASLVVFLGTCFYSLYRSNEVGKGLAIVAIAAFAFLFITVPYFLEGIESVRYRAVFGYEGFAKFVSDSGHFAPEIERFHSWPGAFTAYSAIHLVTGVGYQRIMLFTPALMTLVMVAFFGEMCILTERKSQKEVPFVFLVVAVAAFVVIRWENQDYMSGQGYATLLLFAVWMLFLITYVVDSPVTKIAWVVAFFALSLTHLFTAVVGLLGVALMLGITRRSDSVLSVSLLVAILLAWNMFVSMNFMQYSLIEAWQSMFDLRNLFQIGAARYLHNTELNQIVATTRIVATAVVGTIAVLGVVFGFIRQRAALITNAFLFGLLAPLISLPLTSYGGEILFRTYYLLSPALAYFIARAVTSRFMILVVGACLLLLIVPSVVVKYGYEEVNYTHPSELAAAKFVDDNVDGGRIMGWPPAGVWKHVWHSDGHVAAFAPRYIEPEVTTEYRSLIGIANDEIRPPDTICLSPAMRAVYDMYHNRPTEVDELRAWLDVNPSFILVYNAGPDVRVYRARPLGVGDT